MPIDRAQLRAFVTVLREGSFDGAARMLHVTAPAISQRVRQLEERLGQVLIRRGTPCTATDAGAELARHAEQIDMLEAETLHALARLQGFSGLADGDDALHAADDAPPVRIPVVVNADSLDTWFMDVAVAVATPESGPALVLHIQVDDQDHTTSLLRDGSVIAAVTAEPQAVQGCEASALGVMRYIAVASPAFIARWLAVLSTDRADAGATQAEADSADSAAWAALSRAPFIQFNEKDALQARFLGSWAAPSDTGSANARAPSFRLPTTGSFVDACRRGMGWGMVPLQMAAPLLADGTLRQVTRAGRDDGIDVPLYWQRWALRSPVLQRLSATVERVAAASLRAPLADAQQAPARPGAASSGASAPPATR
ncbi:LysR family transcriptional regulator ArgP [Robbsia sp. KACC 23696]|uniref:LysR family transcriptional regulator ArgP n=1 Tax=Robbsia sp. KACC 23696 TaxID=3149231 RepID=UPI00325BE710